MLVVMKDQSVASGKRSVDIKGGSCTKKAVTRSRVHNRRGLPLEFDIMM